MNAEILEEMIKNRVEKKVTEKNRRTLAQKKHYGSQVLALSILNQEPVEQKQNAYFNSDIKSAGVDLITKFKNLSNTFKGSSTIMDIYSNVKSKLDMEYCDKASTKFKVGDTNMQSLEDRKLIKQEKERILLADFGQRYDIYLMYTKTVHKVSQSNNLIKYLTAEKNSIDEEKKLLIDSMGKQFGWTVNGIFNVKLQMEKTETKLTEGPKVRLGGIATMLKKKNHRKMGYNSNEMFDQNDDGNSDASPLKRAADSHKGEAHLKLEWAN